MKGKISTYFSYGNFYKSKAEIFYPKTIEEINGICSLAREKNRKICIAGSFHSFDNQNSGNDIVISLKKIDFITFDSKNYTIEVGPGTNWGKILKEAYKHHCVPFICITGSKPTAGGTLSAHTNSVFTPALGKEGKHCVDFDLLTTDGRLLKCSRTENSEFFYGAISGLGILGFITRIKYQLFFIGSDYQIKLKCQYCDSITNLETSFNLRASQSLLQIEDLKSQSSLFYIEKGEYKYVIFDRSYEKVAKKEKSHFNIYLYIASVITFVIRFFPNYANKIMQEDRYKPESEKKVLKGLKRIYYGTFWAEPDYIWNKYISKLLSVFGYKAKLYQNSYFVPLQDNQVSTFVKITCDLLKKYKLNFTMFDVMYIPKDEPFILSSSKETDGFYVNTTFFDRTNVSNLMAFYEELNQLCLQMNGKMNLVKNLFCKTEILEKMYEKETKELLILKNISDKDNLIQSNFFLEKFPKTFTK